ncbi:MAG: glucosamine-6-phosphate deaminase [Planctomycetes bacterium]|jgi:glucosamine-6-phosphate deaminase|nr:glucosamine-6-phosphate deaminase [Planctomycetota bacterium]
MGGGATRINSILIEKHSDVEGLAQRGAELVGEVLASNPEAVVLLPAGATPIPLYAELSRRQSAGAIELSRARLFQLDELVGVAQDDPRSFHAFLQRQFLDTIERTDHPHLLNGCASDPAAEIQRHAVQLESLGGADLALLGIGSNGHIAFNEPGTAIDGPARLVSLAKETRAGLEQDFPKSEMPRHGITLGIREIFAAKKIVLIATGHSKAPCLRDLIRGPATQALPASLLNGHADFLVLCDEEAGQLL